MTLHLEARHPQWLNTIPLERIEAELRSLADALERGEGLLNMEIWSGDLGPETGGPPPCGTPMCIGGHLAARLCETNKSYAQALQYLKAWSFYVRPAPDGPLLRRLFMPTDDHGRNPGWQADGPQAATAIRRWLANQEPWP